MKRPRTIIASSIALLLALPFTYAVKPSCTAVASVSSCVKAIGLSLTKTKSASSFCSSILGCTTTPTVTLTGTVTTTITSSVTQTYTFEQIVCEPLIILLQFCDAYYWVLGYRDNNHYHLFLDVRFYVAFSDHDSISHVLYGVSATPGENGSSYTDRYSRKFVVTTVKAKRDETLHPKDLVGRATTSAASACPSAMANKACSCIVTCPATVTKDNRRTHKEQTTETNYAVSPLTPDVQCSGYANHKKFL